MSYRCPKDILCIALKYPFFRTPPPRLTLPSPPPLASALLFWPLLDRMHLRYLFGVLMIVFGYSLDILLIP